MGNLMKNLVGLVVLVVVSACWEPHTVSGVAVRVPEPQGPITEAQKEDHICLFVYCPTNELTKACTQVIGKYEQSMSDRAIDNTVANGTSFSSCGDTQTVTQSKLYRQVFK